VVWRFGLNSERESHRETAEAWEVVARAKYDAEFQEHVRLLRSGRHNLLDVERKLIGTALAGSHVVHLQCSHGLDSLGLLNAGAASVLGIDISEEMIRQARAKAAAVGAQSAEFLCADVTDLPSELFSIADLVYTGRGSLPWVLDLEAWSESVSRLLRPKGLLFIFEGHPLDALWEREAERLVLRPHVGYFDETPDESPGFPADVVARECGADRPRVLERQWRPGEVIEALLARGLELKGFREYPEMFWNQFPNWPNDLKNRLPHTYSILARKPVRVEQGSA
jgi:SAM-dependent methyltransferase